MTPMFILPCAHISGTLDYQISVVYQTKVVLRKFQVLIGVALLTNNTYIGYLGQVFYISKNESVALG